MDPSFAPREVPWVFQKHSSNAGLILNPSTGYLSVQFHVLYNDEFMAVPGIDEDQRASLDQLDWPNLIVCQGGSEIHYDDEDIVPYNFIIHLLLIHLTLKMETRMHSLFNATATCCSIVDRNAVYIGQCRMHKDRVDSIMRQSQIL